MAEVMEQNLVPAMRVLQKSRELFTDDTVTMTHTIKGAVCEINFGKLSRLVFVGQRSIRHEFSVDGVEFFRGGKESVVPYGFDNAIARALAPIEFFAEHGYSEDMIGLSFHVGNGLAAAVGPNNVHRVSMKHSLRPRVSYAAEHFAKRFRTDPALHEFRVKASQLCGNDSFFTVGEMLARSDEFSKLPFIAFTSRSVHTATVGIRSGDEIFCTDVRVTKDGRGVSLANTSLDYAKKKEVYTTIRKAFEHPSSATYGSIAGSLVSTLESLCGWSDEYISKLASKVCLLLEPPSYEGVDRKYIEPSIDVLAALITVARKREVKNVSVLNIPVDVSSALPGLVMLDELETSLTASVLEIEFKA